MAASGWRKILFAKRNLSFVICHSRSAAFHPFDALNACLYPACRDAQGRPLTLFASLLEILPSFFVRFAPFRGYSDLTFLPPHLRKSAFICGSSVFSLRLCVRFYFASFRVHSRLSFSKRRPIQSGLGPSPVPPPAVPV